MKSIDEERADWEKAASAEEVDMSIEIEISEALARIEKATNLLAGRDPDLATLLNSFAGADILRRAVDTFRDVSMEHYINVFGEKEDVDCVKDCESGECSTCDGEWGHDG